MVGFVLAGVFAAVGAAPIVAGAFFGLLVAILPLILLVLGIPVLIHELGHLAAARHLGMKVVGFDVFGISFMGGASREVGHRDPLGFVSVRTTLAQDCPAVWRPFLLAGPLAGFAFAAAEAVLTPLAPPALGPFLACQCLGGLVLNVNSLIPRERFGRRNDGAKMRDVRRHDSQTFAHTAYRRVMEALAGADVLGCHPEDLRRALHLRDPHPRAYAASAVCYRALLERRGEIAAARAYLHASDEALATSTEATQRDQIAILRSDAIFELAFAQALEGCDEEAESTLALLDRIEPSDFHNALRVDAALAWARNDEEETSRRVARARAHLERQRETKPGPVWNAAESFLALIPMPSPMSPERDHEVRGDGPSG